MGTQAPTIITSKTEAAQDPWAADGMSECVKDCVAHKNNLNEQLSGRRQEVRMWMQRYLHDKRAFDKRTEAERRGGRPFLMDPHGYTNVQTLAASGTDSFMASLPAIAVRGRGDEDQGDKPLEKLLNFDLTELNPASEWVEETLTRAPIQGISILQMRHVDERTEINLRVRPWDKAIWKEAVQKAEEALGHPAPMGRDGRPDPVEFRRWAAAASEKGVQVPDPPVEQKTRMAGHVGPKIRVCELDDVTWDPTQPRIEDPNSPIYYHSFIPYDALIKAATDNPDVWDERKIKELERQPGTGQKSGSEIFEAYLRSLGMTNVGVSGNPAYKNMVDVWQRWSPFDSKVRYTAIANDALPLTKDPLYYPLDIPMLPFFGYQNVPTMGASVGISEYQPNGDMHAYLDAVQSMKLYWMMLQLFQPLKVLAGTNLAKKLENIEFSKVYEVEAMDDVDLLFKNLAGQLQISDGEMDSMRLSIDRAMGIYDRDRGAPAQINRVTGVEFSGRATAADARKKSRLYRLGVMICRYMCKFDLALRWQYGEPQDVLNIAGQEAMEMMSTQTLLRGLEQDYIFMPAMVAGDSALQQQQLNELVQTLTQMGALTPNGKALPMILSQMLKARRVQNGAEIAAAVTADAQEAKDAADQTQQLQGQVQELTKQNEALTREVNAIRTKLMPPIPPTQALEAEVAALRGEQTAEPEEQAEGQPEQGEQMPPEMAMPPGGMPQ